MLWIFGKEKSDCNCSECKIFGVCSFPLYYIQPYYKNLFLLGKKNSKNPNHQILHTRVKHMLVPPHILLLPACNCISSSTKVSLLLEALSKLLLLAPHHCCLVLNISTLPWKKYNLKLKHAFLDVFCSAPSKMWKRLSAENRA